jgi:hypothetical protein
VSFLGRLKQPRAGIAFGVVGAAALAMGLAVFIYGNWLVAVILGLLVALIALVAVLLRAVIVQEREERLDRGFDAADAAAGDTRATGRADLHTSFRRSLAELRASRLGRDGIHALPWYLVLGECGAGKSALIRASGLELPAEFAHVAHGGATGDCDWWFTNEAILLDTAGRYTDSDEDGDRREWRTLLKLVRKSRPKRPIEGIVVALSAPRLLESGPSDLEEQARGLRRRINEATDALSVDMPIYLVVTKADQVEGFAEFMSTLAPSRLQEAFGWTNAERRFADAGDVLRRGLEDIRSRLDAVVPEIVMRDADPVRQRRTAQFPHEFEALSERLVAFGRSAFAPSVYQETPFLRGVYLSSAVRSGATASAVLSRLGHDWARTQHVAGPASGMFLRDLFRDVILGDRDLALPITTLGPRARRAILLAGAAAAGFAILGCGIASVRIYRNQRLIADAAHRVNDAPSRMELVERLRRDIVAAENLTVLGRFGLGAVLDRAVDRGKAVFLRAFGSEFEEHAKARLRAEVRKLDPSAFEALAELALDLSWLQSRAGTGAASRPHLADYARIGNNAVDREAFTAGYDSFVRWAPETEIEDRLETERRTLTTASTTVLSLKYLERWADANRDRHPPVRYADLGLPQPSQSVRDSLSSAYTRATWETLVRGLVAGVQDTGGAPERSIQQFRRGYVANYDAAWERFILNASLAPRVDPNVKESPYLGLLAHVQREMQADLPRDVAPEPVWLATLNEVLRDAPLEKPEQGGLRLFGGDDEAEGDEQEEALPPWDRYLVALDGVAKDVEVAQTSSEDALKTAVEVATTDATSFDLAIAEIRSIVPREGDPEVNRKLRGILEMPVLNGLQVVLGASAIEFDRQWRTAIAGVYGGSLDESELVALYGLGGGALEKFQDTWLTPFYEEGRSKPVLRDLPMPFGPAFLEWLGSAYQVQRALSGHSDLGAPEIAIRLVGLPSRVLAGGVVVKKRMLRIDCTNSILNLEYRPHRAHSIDWTPQCSDVELRVSVLEGGAERELPKRSWRGPLAVPSFFQAADRDGELFVWKVEDRERRIAVSIPYQMKSGRSILAVTHRNPPNSVLD